MTTDIDIERLLVWAFREELPKGRPVSAVPWSRLDQLAQYGTLLDTGISPSMGWVLGEPDPDALLVLAAVRQLDRDVGVDWPACREALMGTMAAITPDDVLMLSLRPHALVYLHACMGTRPDWGDEPLECGPVIGANGKPVVVYEDGSQLVVGRTRGRHYGPAARCPIRWAPEPARIALDRAEYSAWHWALGRLQASLRGSLGRWRPTGPKAPAQPWIDAREPRSRVLWSRAA